MLHAILIKGTFQDSVTLMLLSRDLSALPGVKSVAAMMGTAANSNGVVITSVISTTPNHAYRFYGRHA